MTSMESIVSFAGMVLLIAAASVFIAWVILTSLKIQTNKEVCVISEAWKLKNILENSVIDHIVDGPSDSRWNRLIPKGRITINGVGIGKWQTLEEIVKIQEWLQSVADQDRCIVHCDSKSEVTCRESCERFREPSEVVT